MVKSLDFNTVMCYNMVAKHYLKGEQQMTKRFIAAMLALTMCAGSAGCGSVSKGIKDKTSNSANETGTNNMEDNGRIKMLSNLKSENIVYNSFSDGDTNQPTTEETLMLAELALEQYSAAQSGDAEKFKQTFNFEKVLDAMADSMYVSYSVDNSRNEIESGIAFLWAYMLEASVDEETLMNIEKAKRSSVEECKKQLKQAYENFDPDTLDTSIWMQKDSLHPLGDINDKTIVRITLNDFQREDNAMEMHIDIDVINGEYRTSLTNIDAWRIDSDIGILVGDAKCKVNEFADMTAEEVDQRITDENNASTARWIYDFVSDYLAPKKTRSEDPKTVLETDFPQCSSSAGLDLSGNDPEASGDSWIFTLTDSDGTVSFGPFNEEKGLPEYVIYTSADGTVTKYPDNSEDQH